MTSTEQNPPEILMSETRLAIRYKGAIMKVTNITVKYHKHQLIIIFKKYEIHGTGNGK